MTLYQAVDLLVATCKLEDSCARDLITYTAPEDIKRASIDYKLALESRKRLQNDLCSRLITLESTVKIRPEYASLRLLFQLDATDGAETTRASTSQLHP